MTTKKVVCPECGYRKVVGADAEKTAAEYIIEHGRERGHQLRIEPMPDEGDNKEA